MGRMDIPGEFDTQTLRDYRKRSKSGSWQISLNEMLQSSVRVTATGVPEGYDALILSGQADRVLLHVCRDDARMAVLSGAVRFFAPNLTVIEFPAWDCLPYDRVSPNPEIIAQRLDSLGKLAGKIESGLVLTTVSAILQRVPDPDLFHRGGLTGKVSGRISQDEFTEYFMRNGYRRAATVREADDYAFRGIVDVFPPGARTYRLDFFGDELETIHSIR